MEQINLSYLPHDLLIRSSLSFQNIWQNKSSTSALVQLSFLELVIRIQLKPRIKKKKKNYLNTEKLPQIINLYRIVIDIFF